MSKIRDRVREDIIGHLADVLNFEDEPSDAWKKYLKQKAKRILAIPNLAKGLEAVEKNWNARVDRDAELPQYKAGRAVDTWIALERELYKQAQVDMLKAGWVKEIKDVEFKENGKQPSK